MSDDDAKVEYTVKELLGRIEKHQAEGFTRLETAMSSKADKADLAKMEGRLDDHGRRLGAIEVWRRDRDVAADVHTSRDLKTWSTRKKALTGLATLIGWLTVLFGPWLANHLH